VLEQAQIYGYQEELLRKTENIINKREVVEQIQWIKLSKLKGKCGTIRGTPSQKALLTIHLKFYKVTSVSGLPDLCKRNPDN
jgi:hypothetical protein